MTTPSTSAQGPVAGWKLVPVEPTNEMLDAMSAWAKFPVDAYAAMLTATPSPAASPASPSGVREALTFEALQAAYLRGAEWVTKIGRYTAADLRKAAYDYADKMTPLASDATPAPASGSEDELAAFYQSWLDNWRKKLGTLAKPASEPAGGVRGAAQAVAMTERLIDAAVYNETASGAYVSGARKELNDARAAIEVALSRSPD